MSQENVDVVRGIWEADRRRDWDAVYSSYDRDVVWEDHAGLWGDWGVARGPDGIREAWRRWYEAFDGVRFEWVEVADGDDFVVVTYEIHGRGRGSGVEVQLAVTLVWQLAGGKVVRISAYLTRPEALEAAGI
jgi:ketosteroid isomerase-like protein